MKVFTLYRIIIKSANSITRTAITDYMKKEVAMSVCEKLNEESIDEYGRFLAQYEIEENEIEE